MNGLLDCGTTYTWWVNVTDGTGYTNESFSFTTVDCTISHEIDISPDNNSVDVCPCFTPLCFNVSTNGFNVNYTIYMSNDTGYYIHDSQSNVTDGRYCLCLCGLRYNETYSWYVNVSEYGNDSLYNQTEIHTFTTAQNINSCLSVLVGDTMEISISEFSVIISFILFAFFFWIGYTSEKRSGGVFMIFAGFVMFYLEAVLIPYVSIVFVIPFLSPVAIFVILLGIKKFLYSDDAEKKRTAD